MSAVTENDSERADSGIPGHTVGGALGAFAFDPIEPRLGRTRGTPVWLTLGPEPMYAVLHAGHPARRRDTAVLLLPTFGWDDMTSYRARREWAAKLAEAGYTTLRIDLPGTEESVGSPLEPGRWDTWLRAVTDSLTWLRENAGCGRVAAIGLGHGGLLAVQALAAGSQIDDLILWAVPARARTYLRELRVHADLISGSAGEAHPVRADGALELSGYVMSAETVQIIKEMRLTDLQLSAYSSSRVRMLSRDEYPADQDLRRALEVAGFDVSELEVNDFADLMAHPEAARIPQASIAKTIQWLDESSSMDLGGPPVRAEKLSDTITFEYEGRMISERLIEHDTPAGRVVGVVTEPCDGERSRFCMFAVSTGALRRGGPNRTQTEQARHCAARGVPAVRFDLPGIGDSDGKFISRLERTRSHDVEGASLLSELFDLVEEKGIADRFVMVGLCSGARWGLMMASADPRVVAGVLINMPNLRWRPAVWVPLISEEAIDPRELTKRHAIGAALRRLPEPESGLLGSLTWALIHTGRQLCESGYRADCRALRRALRSASERGTRLTFLFSLDEPVYRLLAESGLLARLRRSRTVIVDQLPTRDHEVRPIWVREQVNSRLDQMLDELMAASRAERVR